MYVAKRKFRTEILPKIKQYVRLQFCMKMKMNLFKQYSRLPTNMNSQWQICWIFLRIISNFYIQYRNFTSFDSRWTNRHASTGNRTDDQAGLHDQCSNHWAIGAQSSHIVFFSEWYLNTLKKKMRHRTQKGFVHSREPKKVLNSSQFSEPF